MENLKFEKFAQFEQEYKVFSGYLSADPEIRYMESGKVKLSFSIPLKKGKDGETEWLNCVCWNAIIAENIAEKYQKGNEITVMGYFTEQEYKDKTYLNFVVKMAM